MKAWARRGLGILLLTGIAQKGQAEPGIGLVNDPHQTWATESTPVYPADFFAPFQPRTALDMLDRTPGFTLWEGTEMRGFGGVAGNVLIGGQRPTVKAGGIAEVLRRIPAARVERIVLLRGGETAEAQGQILIANLILKVDDSGSGTATFNLARTFDGKLSPSGHVSHAQRIGGWQTSVELSAELVHFPAEGRYRLHDQSGTLVETQTESISGKSPEAGTAISASRPLAGGTFSLNARLDYDGYSSRRTLIIHPGDFDTPPTARNDISYDDEEYFAELGIDWTRSLGSSWTAKLVGLGYIERFHAKEDFSGPDHRGIWELRRRPAEAIGRVTLGREGEHRLRPELGIELAWNALTSHLDYAEDRGAGFTPIDLSGADTRVTELRNEAFMNIGASLGSDFAMEADMAFELSRIRATGDGTSTQNLTYLKPSAALIWSPVGTTDIRLGARRTIDQLEFGDFAASVDQADGRPLGGNDGLRPARITRIYLRLDHRWNADSAVSAEVFHQRHEGLLGYILLPSQDQALGTIGNGREWGIAAQATLPLTAIVPDARLKFDGTLRHSSVRDTAAGGTRPIDDLPNSTLSAEFRQDLPTLKAAWGVRYTAAESARIHFVGEEYSWRDHPAWTAYVETTAIAGFKTVFTVEGITGRNGDRLRRFRSPDAAETLLGTEARSQNEGVLVSLSLVRSL